MPIVSRSVGGQRRGTVLILVAGICALLASLSLAFMITMRAAAEESRALVCDAQARIMLYAACNYIQEASRLGYDNGPDHGEAHGWIDVRDGSEGPKINLGDPPRFARGVPRRFPMYVWQQTRYAIRPTTAYNPISTDEADDSRFGRPYLANPDPQPVATEFSSASSTGQVRDHLHGDALITPGRDPVGTPRWNSVNLSWFRILRVDQARFLVTCGAGQTQGFRSFQEASTDLGADAASQLFGDADMFTQFRDQEVRAWYQVEWSPAVIGGINNTTDGGIIGAEHFIMLPENASHQYYPGGVASQSNSRNMVGTIRWIQRLTTEPAAW
ncbi:MAG: hypothetical protein H0X38_01815 [Planctomycetes bacterium]|nr:hypothetical protein [Planctomycetota bacterium]